jgi:hypothetical protein
MPGHPSSPPPEDVAGRGLFVSERQMEFDIRVYGSSGDELGDFLADAYAHANQACEEACDAFTSELFGRVDRITAGQAGRDGSRLPRTGADYSAETRDCVSRGAPARHRPTRVIGLVRRVRLDEPVGLGSCRASDSPPKLTP